MAAMARAVELSPRSRTGSGAGSSLPNALSGERFRGIIRTVKDALRTETALAPLSLNIGAAVTGFGGGL